MSASLVVVQPPVVRDLFFWALQVTFDDGSGAHVGLQRLSDGSHAANWGGYVPDGRMELEGRPGPNTQRFDWVVGRSYELRVAPSGPGLWRGVVEGEDGSTWSRELVVPGTSSLRSPMVWSEVFARCDHPSTRVRWSSLRADDADVQRVRTSYQANGCANTNSFADGDGFVQATGTRRVVGAGAVLEVEAH